MSLSLPYPNLDFVPLDVLTADEMNQIVANYTYISNQFPLTASAIASGAVTSDKVDWTTMGGIGDYSLTEQETPFKWIDGKTIYKKTVNFGALPNNSSIGVNHGIDGLGMLCHFYGVTYNPTSGIRRPLPSVGTTAAQVVQASIDNSQVWLATASNLSAFSQTYITFYYTKQ